MTDVYIRHRPRMVQESLFEDLKNTLIACRWMVGTTTRPVINPANDTLEVVTTLLAGVYPLTEGQPLTAIDYLPEGSSTATLNTMAMAPGTPGMSEVMELGSSSLREQPYLFEFAFYATTDALASSVFSDLKDRYEGRLVAPDAIPIFDYLTDPDAVVAYLDIETFRFNRDPESISPDGAQLYFAAIEVTDYA